MSKNIILNGQTYSGVSEIKLPVSGGTAKFKDEDEIVTPSGTKTITENGNGINVAAFEKVNVNVQGGGDAPTYQEKTVTANGVVLPDEGYDALSKVTVNVSGGGGISLPTHATSRIITVEETVGGNSGEALSACNALNLAAHEVAYLIDEQTAEAQLLFVFSESTSKYHTLRYRTSAVQYTLVTSDSAAGGIVAGTRYVVLTWA